MKISTVGCFTTNSPLSSPRGQAQAPVGFMSQTNPTSSPISSNQPSPGKRVLRASASFNGRPISASCATEEKRDINIAFRKKKDHYALLGVPCDSSYSDIRVAYRKLALKYHPDVKPLHQLETATELFSEINKAYDTLSDPQKRKAYDALHIIPNFDTARTAASPSSSSPFGQWKGRNWETDQCWCWWGILRRKFSDSRLWCISYPEPFTLVVLNSEKGSFEFWQCNMT